MLRSFLQSAILTSPWLRARQSGVPEASQKWHRVEVGSTFSPNAELSFQSNQLDVLGLLGWLSGSSRSPNEPNMGPKMVQKGIGKALKKRPHAQDTARRLSRSPRCHQNDIKMTPHNLQKVTKCDQKVSNMGSKWLLKSSLAPQAYPKALRGSDMFPNSMPRDSASLQHELKMVHLLPSGSV